MKTNRLKVYSLNKLLLLLIVMATNLNSAYADETTIIPIALIEDLAEIWLKFGSREELIAPLSQLLVEAETYRDRHADNAGAWIACAYIRASRAKGGGLSQLGEMKTARKDLENAVKLDSQALHGFSQALLGRLYSTMPGWPLGFGSEKKAEQQFKEALSIDSEAGTNNYYYALFLIDRNEQEVAKTHLLRAKSTLSQFNLSNWDALLLRDIDDALAQLH